MLCATRRAIALAAVALCLGVTACSDDDSRPAAASEAGAPTTQPIPITAASAPATTAKTLAETAGGDIDCGNRATWSNTGQEDNFPELFSGHVISRVVPSRGNACEEIRFVLSGPSPSGYRIEYGRPWNDENGVTVDVAGDAALIVILNAPTGSQGDAADQTVSSSPLDLRANYFRDWRSLRELKQLGHIPGGSVWAIGVQSERPFRAYTEPGQDNAWTLVLQVAT